ncbi:MAG: hypothetical protein KAX31_02040 [Thermoplasmata archaeon]|nr:hypothetical protein [Thermoplasmata archaeon]
MGKKYWTFETFKGGLETCWKDYQVVCMRYLWGLDEGEGAGSGKAWIAVNKVLKKRKKSISRASIIFFMNDMVDEGVLKFIERTGKGGHHRVYSPAFDETGFREYLARKIIGKLMLEFPDETKKVIFGVKTGSS